MKTKNKIISILFILLIVLICIFSAIQNHIFNQQVLSEVNYTYPEIQNIPLTINIHSDAAIKISFDFIQKGWHGEWDNLFQTAEGNKGIRLEVCEKTNSFALVFSHQKNELSAAGLTFVPELNKWHTFKADIHKENVKIWIDSIQLFDKEIEGLSFSINDISVGSGFSKQRLFNGSIKNFNIEIENFVLLDKVINFTLHQLLIILFAYLLITVPSIKRQKNSIINSIIWIIIVFFILLSLNRVFPIANFQIMFLLRYEVGILFAFFIHRILSHVKMPHLAELTACSCFFAYINSFFVELSLSGLLYYFLLVFTAGLAAIYFIRKISNNSIKLLAFALIEAIVFIVFLFFTFGAMYLFKVGDTYLNIDEVGAFFQSNFRESFEFFTSFFSYVQITIMFLVSAIATFLFGRSMVAAIRKSYKFPLKVLILLIFSAVLAFYYAGPKSNLVYNLAISVKNYKQISNELKKYMELRDAERSIPAEKKQTGELYFIIIGEASNQDHWSAYGYFRDTTPWALYERANNPNALFFDNAYSSFAHTVPSLIKALSTSNQYNGQNDFTAVSLIEVAKAAGFKTYWLSNQDKISLVDNPLTVLAYGADKIIFTNTSRFSTDSDLLPIIDKTLKSINTEENNLIILHIIGSHAKYQKRYPKIFYRDFKNGEDFLGNNARDNSFIKNILNPYDNTIAFTDSILKQIYEKFQNMPNQTKLFLFFSDHGEDVYGRKYHNSSIFTYPMVRIPMFMIFSDFYAKTYKHKIEELAKRTESIFTLDLLFNLACSLLDISTPLNESKYDFTSSDYSINKCNAVTMYTDNTLQSNLYNPTEAQKIYNDPRKLKIKNLEELKIKFPHKYFGAIHVDAVGACIQSVKENFDTVEINVTAPDLKMGHGPHLVYDMTLEEYLSLVPLNKLKMIWIDMKELKEQDIDNVIDKLNELDKKFNIKHRSLIENTLISESMKKFTENGWRNCFYSFIKLSKDDLNRGLSFDIKELLEKENKSQEEEAELQNLASTIAETIKKQKASDLSFYAFLYPFVKKYIEPLLSENILYNTFAIDGILAIDNPNIQQESEKNIIFNDNRVNIILIDPKTDFTISL